ncbi:SOS response-associated peptidase [Virgibacillus necropolis]|uniref:SOS response-associated peptidase n=1 Tax=Virgibacillus necropolis TaxID=163877 RepID=UPI00384F48AE
MCGRYTLLREEVEILKEFGIQHSIDSFQPSYNIAPGQNILAVIHNGKDKRAGYLKWGLVPSWSSDEKIGYKMINARSETVHQKPSFKKLLKRKRCLIIADSFYEWKKTDEAKQPKRIQLADRKLFAFAGLWDKWEDDDRNLFTCTILTKEANGFMQDIHHRMPIILPKDKEDEWISPNEMDAGSAYNFLQSIQVDDLKAHNVSSHVNTAKNNGPSCIEPLVN